MSSIYYNYGYIIRQKRYRLW